MKTKSEKHSKKSKLKFLKPKMKFNAGIMGYEPVLPKSKYTANKRMSKSEKINAWVFIASIITLIVMTILFLILIINVF